MNAAVRLGTTGFALIAVSYGLARFAFGLFLPQIRGDLGLSISLGGVIAGTSFLGYCVAITLSAGLTERFGPRPVAVLAGVAATAGLAFISLSTNQTMLVVAVLLAGLSTGFASPPLAAAVASVVDPPHRDMTNTIINAGTSIGVAVSGPVALLFAADWRLAYMIFCGLAMLTTIATFVVVPGATRCVSPMRFTLPRLTLQLRKLMIAAFLMGAASTAIWSFGGELAARTMSWTNREIGALWIVLGISGGFGAFAGGLVARFGINPVHRMSLVALATGIICIGYPETSAPLIMSGAVLFGGAYIMLTGVHLVWGIAALPDRPATGLTIAFLSIAIGQTAGAPLFGWLLETMPPLVPAISFAAVGILAGTASYQADAKIME